MRANCQGDGVTFHEAGIENPGALGTFQRYHAPRRSTFLKIRAELGRETTARYCLQLAVFSVIATIGTEGLCPMLLVFGVIPRPARKTPSLTQTERSQAVKKAMIDVENEEAKRQIVLGLKHRTGTKVLEASLSLRTLPADSKISVWRTMPKLWDGPHTLISNDGETAFLEMKRGRRIFVSHCVRP